MATGEPAVREIVPVIDAERAIFVRWSREVAGFARRKPLGAVAGIVVLVFIFLGIFGGALAPHRYDTINISERLEGPSSAHVFGTDEQGRDVFSRVLYGARVSIIIGFSVVLLSATMAGIIGISTGYFGGWFDLLFQRLIDIKIAFPGLIFLIFIVSVFGNAMIVLIVALALLFFAASSRVIRGATLSIKENAYVEAARVIGAGHARIMLRHMLPNIFPLIIISASTQISYVILIESSLSFLGFGVPPPHATWGGMLNAAQQYMRHNPHLALFPGMAIVVTVYSFNMFGDALRDVLDPRMRGSR